MPTPEELLAQVCSRPADDALRLVLADSLLEHGDPRGQFIALQMRVHRDEATPEHHALVNALLKKHRSRWLGPLGPWVDPGSVEFTRGYLGRATLLESALNSASWRHEPTLALLEELLLPELASAEVVALLRSVPTLRGVGLHSSVSLPRLLGEAVPWPLEQLGLAGTARSVLGDLERVAKSPSLPSLARVSLRLERFGRSAMLALARGLANHPVGPRLTHLTLHAKAEALDVGYAVSQVATALPAATITFENASLVVTHQRSRGVTVRGTTGASPLCNLIAGLNLPSLPRLRVLQLSGALPAEDELDRLKNDLRRLGPTVVDLPESWGL